MFCFSAVENMLRLGTVTIVGVKMKISSPTSMQIVSPSGETVCLWFHCVAWLSLLLTWGTAFALVLSLLMAIVSLCETHLFNILRFANACLQYKWIVYSIPFITLFSLRSTVSVDLYSALRRVTIQWCSFTLHYFFTLWSIGHHC